MLTATLVEKDTALGEKEVVVQNAEAALKEKETFLSMFLEAAQA